MRVYWKVLNHIFVFSILFLVFLGRYLTYPKSFIKKDITSLMGEIVSINYQKSFFEIKINSEKVIVYSEDIADLELGMVVKITGELSEVEDINCSRLFSFKKYYASKKIYYSMYAKDILVLENNDSFINYLKNQLIHYISRFKVGNYLFLLLGDSSNLFDGYQTLGISHLLSISGMHFYLLLSVFSKKVKSKFLQNCFMIFLVFFFGFKVSILRSYIYYLFIKFFPKILSHVYVTMILLVINPFYIYQSGFIYSIIVSFFISILKKKTILNILVVAFVSSLPLNIYYNYSFSLFSIFYNFIFTPLINLILFPSLLITFLLPFLDSFCYFIVLVIEEMVNFFLKFDVVIYMFKPALYIVILYYVILFSCYYKRIFIIFYLIVFSFHFMYPSFLEEMIVFFDVGQGDSTLIYVGNKLVLIDTGGYYNSNNVQKEIIPFIHSLGFYKLDYLILSHGGIVLRIRIT